MDMSMTEDLQGNMMLFTGRGTGIVAAAHAPSGHNMRAEPQEICAQAAWAWRNPNSLPNTASISRRNCTGKASLS
jgi:hypothetical protein